MVREILPWATKSGFAIVDQALFAGTNFVVNILLARFLPPGEYGAFALAYSVFLLFSTFHAASLIEPMMVFGPGEYAPHFREYLGILMRGHFYLMLPGSAVLAAAAFLLGRIDSASIEHAFFGLALAAPFILLLWLVRRAFYVRLQPEWAAAGGCIYLACLLALVAVLWAGQRLSPFTAFIGMCIAAAMVSAFLVAILGVRWKAGRGGPSPAIVFAKHWQYGRWSVATAGISWLPSNVYYVLLPYWFGLEAAGAFRALMNLAMPVLHTVSALSLILLPILVRNQGRSDTARSRRTIESFLGLFLLGSGSYLALLWTWHSEIFRLLYGGKYDAYSSMPLLLVGLLPFGSSIAAVLGCALRALERPEWIFWSYLGSGAVTLFVGIPLAATVGVSGGLIGLLLSYLVAAALMFGFYGRTSVRAAST